MSKAGEEGAKVGLQLAEELLEELRPIIQGTYLVPIWSLRRHGGASHTPQKQSKDQHKEVGKTLSLLRRW